MEFKKVVFVDFFNTIVLRNMSPNDVIYSFSELLGNKYSIEPSTVYRVFVKCKNKLAVNNFLRYGESEYTFEDIVDKTFEVLKNLLPLDKTAFAQDAMNCYIEAESSCISAKQQTLEMLKKFRNDGARIIVLSDFYCKKEILRIWLVKLGISELFDDIIVSCEHKKSKRSGKLYKVALSLENVLPQDALMVGDSWKSDCRNAARHKIKYVRLKEKQLSSGKELKQKAKFGINFAKYREIFEQCPNYRYSNYAFALYLFEKRLCARLEQENIKNVFFFSREGQYLKKLFDDYCRLTGKGKDIATHYIYVSRNSVLPTSLKPLGEETFDKVFPGVLCVTLRKFLTTLGFSREETEVIAKQVKTHPDKIYANMPHSAMFKRLCQNKLFVEKYDKMRSEQRKIFRAYWESFGVDIYNEKIAVVDVGWTGTMQTLVDRQFEGKVNMVGFYVGTRDRSEKDRATKFGLLYSCKNKTYTRPHLFKHHMTFFEQLLRASHNCTIGYVLKNGMPVPVLDTKIDDAAFFKRDIEPMQREMTAKFEQLCKLDYDYCSTMENVVYRAFYKLSLHPTKKDIEWIMRCEDSHYDQFMRIGYTFAPFKHFMRVFVHTLDNCMFVAKNLGANRVKVITKPQRALDSNHADWQKCRSETNVSEG